MDFIVSYHKMMKSVVQENQNKTTQKCVSLHKEKVLVLITSPYVAKETR